MNLFLHGIGADGRRRAPITVDDALRGRPGRAVRRGADQPAVRQEVVASRSSTRRARPSARTSTVVRDDFWATTSNKQLNFVQHVKTLLKIDGRAAVVVPDNVLFEGGAGETVRRKLLHECDVHTLLRLPTDLLRPGREGERAVLRPQARRRDAVDEGAVGLRPAHEHALHAEDRTRSSARTSTTSSPCYKPGRTRHERDGDASGSSGSPTTSWSRATRPASTSSGCATRRLEDIENLPPPDVIAAEIVEDLEAALAEFAAIAESLRTMGANDADDGTLTFGL